MFKTMLNEILNKKGKITPDDRIQYLSNLKEPAKKLWNGYQSDSITIDYSDPEIQVVYMLRYFPFYLKLIQTELNELSNLHSLTSLKKSDVHLSLFCSGPLPEGYGLSKFIFNVAKPSRLIINSFDLNVSAWAEMRTIVEEMIVTSLKNCSVKINPIHFNMNLQIEESHLQVIEKTDCIVFQNCLNEIYSKCIDLFEESINKVLNRMPPDGIFMIIDRRGYLNQCRLVKL